MTKQLNLEASNGERSRTTFRLDRRAQNILDSFAAENLFSLNAALNFLIKEYSRLRNQEDSATRK